MEEQEWMPTCSCRELGAFEPFGAVWLSDKGGEHARRTTRARAMKLLLGIYACMAYRYHKHESMHARMHTHVYARMLHWHQSKKKHILSAIPPSRPSALASETHKKLNENKHTQTHMHTFTNAHTCAQTHAQIPRRTHTHTHTRTHTRAHTITHEGYTTYPLNQLNQENTTYVYTYTCMLAHKPCSRVHRCANLWKNAWNSQ